MDRLIDDFMTGPDVFEITSETKEDPDNGITVDAQGTVRVDRNRNGDGILGGTRRALLGFNPRLFRNQPARMEFGNENQLNLTVPTAARGGMDLLYGTFAGTELSEDWRDAKTLTVDIGACTTFLPITYAIVLFSGDGGRSRFFGKFVGPPGPSDEVIDLSFAEVPAGDLSRDTPEGPVDLSNVIALHFTCTWNDGFWLKGLRIT